MATAWKEPNTILVVLTAWYLKHGSHTAGDQCTWASTNECQWALDWSQSLNGDYVCGRLFVGPDNPIDPQAPLVVAKVPYSNPLYIKVTAQPTHKIPIISAHGDIHWVEHPDHKTGAYWPGSAYFKYLGHGKWGAEKPPLTSPNTDTDIEAEDRACVNFAPPFSLISESPTHTVTTLIHFFCSQVRLATRRCMQSGEPVQTWQIQQQTVEYIDNPAITSGKLNWMPQQSVNLNSRDEVVEVNGWDGPRLIAVHWPVENDPGTSFPLRAPQAEFLIFFHSSYNQNTPGNYTHFDFPFGFDYVFHGFQSYLQYSDYVQSAYPLSIPYTIKTAGKQTVLILPMNRKMTAAPPELPNLNDGDQCQSILEEIQCMMLRAKPVSPRSGNTNLFAAMYFWDPNIGRMGCGSFSAGVAELFRFKQGADKHAYLKQAVQEYYIFDSKHDSGSDPGSKALALKAWAGNNPNRRVRVYNNQDSPEHAQFLGRGSSPPVPYVQDAGNGRFTAGVVPDGMMQNALNRMLNLPANATNWTHQLTNKVWGTYHANFVRTFLVDALRKSGFR